MKLTHIAWFFTLLLVGAILVGCGATPAPTTTATPAATTTPTTYTDPFAYCAAVGTVDTPGSNYVGPQVPESVTRGLQQALNAPDTPIDVLENGSFWRCMDGSVYACFVDANLPCEAKANTDRTPTREEIDYCQQNPNSDFIPAVVTGRETIYEWHCLDGTPDIVKQLTQPDAQGFLSDVWYRISPVEGQERLPPVIQAELHQIPQEALNNALKYAHAREIQVRLHFGDVATCLEVQDDGVGFDLATAQMGGGLGFPDMKERV